MNTTWTTEETVALISLWPTNSVAQIAKRFNRPRSAICGKIARLRHHGLLPDSAAKLFDVSPRTTRPDRARTKPMPPPPPIAYSPAMRPCSLFKLDDCGGATVAGHRYCSHHLKLALKN